VLVRVTVTTETSVAATTFVTVVATPAMVVTATEVERPASGTVAEAPLLLETVAPGGGRGAPGRVADGPLPPGIMTPGVGATMVTMEVIVTGG
jgi:hypothetical protein